MNRETSAWHGASQMSSFSRMITAAHYDESRLPLQNLPPPCFGVERSTVQLALSHQFALSCGARDPECRCLAADLGALDGPPMGAMSCQPQGRRRGGPGSAAGCASSAESLLWPTIKRRAQECWHYDENSRMTRSSRGMEDFCCS